jgi:polar amino acid transport system substrate-binding protein
MEVFMRTLLSLVLTGLVCLSLSVGSVSAKEIVNGIDANFPPFAYVDQSGKPAGFDVDAMDWIAKKMGFTVKHVPVDWDGIIPNLIAKKIDCIASGMSITEERAKVVDFTIPYWEVKQVLVGPGDAAYSPADVMKGADMTLGVQAGTSEGEWIKAHMEEKGWKVKLRIYDSAPMAVQDVVNGRISAAAMDDAPAADAVAKKGVKILGMFGMPAEAFGYAVRKEDKELLATLNKGLKLLMADPYWDELIHKYNPGAH